MSLHPRTQGFTLIELLVVIAIIGILSSVVLASLSTARTKGQDAARISNVKALETAMELYYSDNNHYPQAGCADCGTGVTTLSGFLVPKDISVIAANLIADTDSYAWDATYGYGLYIYTDAAKNNGYSGFCKAGVNLNPGWWGVGPPTCNF